MSYRFATENKDYSDYSSGRLFYATPGHPAFPVRLISEIFQRCQAIRKQAGLNIETPVTIYDPCCGGAYHLSVLAYLHWAEIASIIGSDVNAEVLQTAEKNLNLLTQAGLDQRQQEIEKMYAEFGKDSHLAALQSVQRFKQMADRNLPVHPINTRLFQADGLNQEEVTGKIKGNTIDIVLADIPYGDMSNWHSNRPADEPLNSLLDTLTTVVSADSVVVIMTNKGQKCNHTQYNRIGRFQIGKRRIFLLQPIS